VLFALLGCADRPDTLRAAPPLEATKTTNAARAEAAPIRVLSLSRVTVPAVQEPTPEVVVQSGHTHAVQDVAFSPDGALLASCGNDSSVKLWDIRLGREIRTLLGAVQSLHTIAFRADGRQVAASGPDGIIYLWNVTDGQPLDPLTGHSAAVRKIVFSSSGRMLASASDDKTAVLWDVESGTPQRVLEHDRRVDDVDFTPDGKLAITWSDSSKLDPEPQAKLTLWDTASGQKIDSLTLNSAYRTRRLGFSPDGKLLAFELNDSTEIYALRPWQRLRSIAGSFLSFRAKDGAICTLPRVGAVRYSEVATGRLLSEVQTPDAPEDAVVRKIRREWSPFAADFPRWDAPAESTVFSADGQLMASATTKATIGVWDAETGGVVQLLGGRIGVSYGRGGGSAMRPFNMAWSPVAPIFATGDRDLVRLVDLRNGAEPRVINAHRGLVSALAFRPDGQVLATASEAELTIRFWEVSTGRLIASLDAKPAKAGVESLAFSPDGRLLASGHWPAEDGVSRVMIWDAVALKPLHVMKDDGPGRAPKFMLARGGRISGVGFLKGGKVLLSAHQFHNRLSQWDVATGERIAVLLPSATLIHGLAVSPDGESFAIGMGANKEASSFEGLELEPWVRYLQPEKDRWQMETLVGHKQLVEAVAFSPNAQLLASGSGDCSVKLWDLTQRVCLATLAGHTSDVGSVTFSHDGRFLASAGFDQAVRLWDVQKRQLAALYVAFGRGDFVMVTPDNYYTASRQGLKGVTFRIGNRAVPFEQFDARLNRPDIVLGRLGYASPQLVESYQRAYQSRLRKMQIREDALGPDYHVPTLTLETAPPLTTRSRKLSVRLRAADGQQRLHRLLAFINDVPIWGAAGLDLQSYDASQAELEVDVELSAGANKVQLSVLNAQGAESLKQTFDIVYQAPARKPDLYVVAIGVSKYKDPQLELQYAAKDASDMAAFFNRQHEHFGTVQVRTILDRDATREQLLAAKEFLNRSTVDDQVVVFVAGHGMLDAHKDYYFGTTDIDVTNMAARGVSYEQIEGLLDRIPARRRLLMMDTCHSGELDQDTAVAVPVVAPPVVAAPVVAALPAATQPQQAVAALPAEVRKRSLRGLKLVVDPKRQLDAAASRALLNELFADLRRGCGGMVISSASGAEFALESPRWKNGVFTYAVLEGLSDRKADLNGDGEIRVSELREYVTSRVQALTAGEQTPTSRRENLEIDFPVF
jgi:WD40 repeat protein/uncharacterized caspase-like protein